MLKTIQSIILLWCLSFTAFVASGNSLSFLDDTPEFLPVEQAFVFEAEVLAPGKVEVFWQIADGYYLYRDKIKFLPSDDAKVELVTPSLPAGTPHEDEFFGTTDVYYNNLVIQFEYQSQTDSQLTIQYMGCAEAGLCYPPTKQKITLPATVVAPTQPAAAQSQQNLAEELASESYLSSLTLFFLLGLGLAFTPCVFPMYPILSAVISGGHKTKTQAFGLSFIYVQGMALTYTALGLLVASFGMQLQAAFQHPMVLLILSAAFVLLALSMFGLYEIQLPRSWQDRLQSRSDGIKGGRLGSVFLLGIIAGLVASPCTTAPLSAALLYVAQSGDIAFGGLALYLLSLGMGLPLLLVGTIGGRLLPKSGPWLNTVKHILGFITLAVPVFLLERLLSETTSQLLWAVLMLTTGGYLMHALKQVKQAITSTVGYMIAGVLLVSGVTLVHSSLSSQKHFQLTSSQEALTEEGELAFITVINQQELMHVLEESAAQQKPALVDFYADWCVACKEFDKYTFPNPAVQSKLSDWTLIRIDVTDSTLQDVELLEHYSILGLPSLLLFNSDGQELTQHRIAGFLKAEAFVSHIEQAIPAS